MTGRHRDSFAFVGCFTTEKRRARGLGIDAYRVEGAAPCDRWTPVERVAGLPNPSFLVSDPTRRVLYAVHGDGDQASAFAVDPDGRLRALGSAATGGTNVVHQALDPSGRFLVVANYATGSVAVLPVDGDGALRAATQVLDMPGPVGPHRSEQAGSHPHQVVFSPGGSFVLVPDKGLDRVFVLALADGRLAHAGALAMRPGAGPRHLAFHPTRPLVFLLNELDSTLATLRWDEATGTLEPAHLASTLPPSFFGASTAAAIAVTPDGRFVYASNRGQDGVARFALGAGAGRAGAPGGAGAGGAAPRFMTLDPTGTRLIVANERGDSLNTFAIDAASGDLRSTGRRDSLSPCTIAFL